MILGFFIKFNKVTKETYAPTLKYTKAGEIKISATTGLEHGTIKPIYILLKTESTEKQEYKLP